MSYLNKHQVLASIKRRTLNYHGREYAIFEAYLGINPINKKPVRKAARSIERLRKFIADFYSRLSSGGDAAVALTAYQSMDARNALDLLVRANMNLSLTECVRRILDDPDAMKECDTTVREAYDAYLAQQAGKSRWHVKSVRGRVGAWVGNFGGDRMLSEVTAKDVAKYLETTFFSGGTEGQKTTYNNHLNYIKTFMAWCAAPERGYIKASPLVSMKPKVRGYVDPEYMKPDETEKLFRVLERRGGPVLAQAILSFFCGMRQDEIVRASKGEKSIVIDLEEKYIRVVECKGSTRGIKPRAFTIPNQALAWMLSMPDFVAAARTKVNKLREHLRDAAREAEVTLPKNAGRHTFCTMFEAAHHDSNALSAIVGNTEEIRDRHYNGVAKPQEGRDYFDILPSGCTSKDSQ